MKPCNGTANTISFVVFNLWIRSGNQEVVQDIKLTGIGV